MGQQRLKRRHHALERQGADPGRRHDADDISSISATLQTSAALTGAINTVHTAQAVNLTLDGSSTWTVTADSYLTCLSDPDGISGTAISNITGNGHTVYYDASACPALGGQTFTLNDGGTLQPAG
jgi:hypothetical protein